MKCFLVTGGESTGTRMMVRSFILCGLPEWEYIRDVDWPFGELPGLPKIDFVLHRGQPIAGRWDDLWEVSKRLRHEGFDVIPVVMTREWFATANSQVKRGFVNDHPQAYENLRSAYRRITQQLHGYHFVSYEQFCLEQKYREWLFNLWGLPSPPIDIHYGNSQYYE